MFTIVAKPRAWWPVSFLGVTEDGEIVTNTFDMQFFILKVDEIADLQKKRSAMAAEIEAKLEAEGAVTASRLGAEMVKLVAGNWRGVAVENQGEVPWNDANLRALCDVPNALDAIMEAWTDCVAARAKVHAGN